MCKSIVNEMLENLLEGRQEWKKELAMMTKEESEKAVNEITEAFRNNLVKEINNMNTNELFDIEEVIIENQRRAVLADMCQDEQEADEYLNVIREQVKEHDEKGYEYHITNSILY